MLFGNCGSCCFQEASEATRADALALLRASEFDSAFPGDRLQVSVRRQLAEMGLDPDAGGAAHVHGRRLCAVLARAPGRPPHRGQLPVPGQVMAEAVAWLVRWVGFVALAGLVGGLAVDLLVLSAHAPELGAVRGRLRALRLGNPQRTGRQEQATRPEHGRQLALRQGAGLPEQGCP